MSSSVAKKMKRTPEKPPIIKLQNEFYMGSSVYCMAFSPVGFFISFAGGSHSRIWTRNLITGNFLRYIEVGVNLGDINALVYTTDGMSIISGSKSSLIHIWSLVSRELTTTLEGHTEAVSTLAISEDGSILYSGSYDCTIRVWNLENKICIGILTGHTNLVVSIAITPDMIISGSYDGTVKCWNRTTRECTKTINNYKRVYTVASYTKPDGSSLFAYGSTNTLINLYDDSLSCIQTLIGHGCSVTSISFNVDGSRLASGSEDNTIRIWNVSDGICLQTLNMQHRHKITSVVSNPGGFLLVSASFEGHICVWISAEEKSSAE